MTEEFKQADLNGDGVLTPDEFQLELKRKRLEIEDADAQRDQQRKMVWWVLAGMLGYPLFVVASSLLGLDKASDILGAMATIYFPSTSFTLAPSESFSLLLNICLMYKTCSGSALNNSYHVSFESISKYSQS